MNIIYLLAASYPRGGIKILIEQANGLARRGHQVRIISNHHSPDWIGLDVPWKKVTLKSGTMLGESLPPCEVAVFSFYEQAYALVTGALRAGAVPIYFAQGDEVIFGDPALAKKEKDRRGIVAAQQSVRLPYPVVTVSNSAAERIKGLGGPAATVIPNGIDRNVFRPRPGLDGDELRVLTVGAELPKFKGIIEVCGVLTKLWREGCRFRLVRASPVENLMGKLEIPVEFHQNPTQEELAKLYSGADLYVGASRNESFYLPPLESMACGTAVVCSDLPAVREYARQERDYLPFPPGNVAEMYHRIKAALQDSGTRRRLAENGLRVAEKMSWEVIIPRIEEYFQTQLGRRKEILGALRRERKHPTVKVTIRPTS